MRFPDPFLQIHRSLRSTEACTLKFLEVPISVKKPCVGNVHWVTPQLILFSAKNGSLTKKKCHFSPKQCLFLRLQGCQELPRGCHQRKVTRAACYGVIGNWWPCPGRGANGIPVPGSSFRDFNKNCCFAILDNWLNSLNLICSLLGQWLEN